MARRLQVSLEELRTLVALAEEGTFARAAKRLSKTPSALVYAVTRLEHELGLELFDRSGYRTRLSEAGARVLTEARRVLAAERAFGDACIELVDGFEPDLRVVYDGILGSPSMLRGLAELRDKVTSTRLHVSTAYLGEVERELFASEADFMVSLVRPQSPELETLRVAKTRALLVAARGHPLTQQSGLGKSQLRAHTLIVVRDSDARLGLSTYELEQMSTFRVADFFAKKIAIAAGLGYGWLPEELIRLDLRHRVLVPLRTKLAAEHEFEPVLAYRRGRRHGRAARLLLERWRALGFLLE